MGLTGIRRRLWRLGALALLALLVGAAAALAGTAKSTRSSPKAAAKPIVIGRVIGRTGFMAAYDGPPADGNDMAIKDINAKGGVLGRPLKVVEGDTKSDLSLVATTADEVLDKHVDVVIASCDFDYGGPAAVEAQKRSKVTISECAGSLKFGPLGIGPLAYTMGAPAPVYGATNAEWAYKKMHWRTAYRLLDTTILFSKEECAGFEQRWKELGGKLAGSDTFQQKDVSVATQITRMKAAKAKPDFIYICSYQPGTATVGKQIRAAGLQTPIVGNGDWDGNYWKSALPNASNIYFSTYGSIFGDDPDAKVNAFFQRYRKELGKAPVTSYPLLGYAMIQAFQRAIDRAKTTDGKAVAAQLNKFHNEPLIIGPTTFDPHFHAILHRTMRMMQVQKGKTSFLTLWTPTRVPDTSKVH